MPNTLVRRRNSLTGVRCGVVLLGMSLIVGKGAMATEIENAPRAAVFASQTLVAPSTHLVPVTADDELSAPATPRPPPQSPLADLDAGELFPAESFAEAAAMPGCTTVASLAERLLGTCLRQGLSASEQLLAGRLLWSAGQQNRTDSWSRDTESLYRLAQCAGSLADQRLVAGAALAVAQSELQLEPTPAPAPPSDCRRDHAQRAQWLWSYRLAVLDVAQGHYLRAGAALFRLHRTAPNRSLLAVITDARNHLSELHSGKLR